MKKRAQYLQNNLPLVVHTLGLLFLYPLQMRIIDGAAGQIRLAAAELTFYRLVSPALLLGAIAFLIFRMVKATERTDGIAVSPEEDNTKRVAVMGAIAYQKSVESDIVECLKDSGLEFRWADDKTTSKVTLYNYGTNHIHGHGVIAMDTNGKIAYIELQESGRRLYNDDFLTKRISDMASTINSVNEFISRIIPDATWRWIDSSRMSIAITSRAKGYHNCAAVMKQAADGHISSIQVTDENGKVHTHCNRAEKAVSEKAAAKTSPKKAKATAASEATPVKTAEVESAPTQPVKKVVLRPDNVLPKAPVQTAEDFGTLDSSGVPDFPRESAAQELIDNHGMEIELAAEQIVQNSTEETPTYEFPAYVGLQDHRDCEIFCQKLLACNGSPFKGYEITKKPGKDGREQLFIKLLINRAAYE